MFTTSDVDVQPVLSSPVKCVWYSSRESLSCPWSCACRGYTSQHALHAGFRHPPWPVAVTLSAWASGIPALLLLVVCSSLSVGSWGRSAPPSGPVWSRTFIETHTQADTRPNSKCILARHPLGSYFWGSYFCHWKRSKLCFWAAAPPRGWV